MKGLTKAKAKGFQKKYLLGLLVLAPLVVILSVSLLRKRQPEVLTSEEAETRNPGIVYDASAVSGGWEDEDTEAITADLDQKVAEGMMNISMNTAPVFQNGRGNVMIVNESSNRLPQVVEILRNDTEEVIYTSGAIPVGSKIETAVLTTAMAPGTYECTARFYNVDPDSGQRTGCAGAVITITVM